MMSTFWQDLRYGARMLLRKPGFTLVAVITLALGIGANTAIFTVVNAVLLRSLPYPQPEQLVRIGGTNLQRNKTLGTMSPQDFYDWRDRNTVFESIAAYDSWSPSLTGTGEPERLAAGRVSASFFNVLKSEPALGRSFLPTEEQRGNQMVAVLSYGLWQRRFGADPKIVGRQIMLNSVGYTVVGVMPRDFESPQFSGIGFEQPELWAPFAPDLTQWSRSGRAVDAAIARLKAGVSLEQAQAEMHLIARQLQQQYPEENAGEDVSLASLHGQLVGKIRSALLVFLVAVGFVLLIACANVANLLLARAAARQREMAIRTALGAGRYRIVRQLLTESLLLSALGGLLGLLLALWATDYLVALGSDSIPRLGSIGLDLRVLSFTTALTFLTGIAFGLAPAISTSNPDLNETLKEGGRTSTGGAGRQRVRSLLVVSEIALSLLLLIGAGLLIKSFMRLQRVDPGFDPRNVLSMSIFLPGTKYPEESQHVAFFDQLDERAASLPGVEAVGMVSNLPVSGNFDTVSFYIEGQPVPAPANVPDVERYTINSDYFRAMGIPLLSGRPFGAQDRADAPAVAIIADTAARRFWPNESPIGKRIKLGSLDNPERPWISIVGVVGDVRHYGLDIAPEPQLYLPHRQNPTQFMTLVVRSTGNPEGQIAAVREQVWAIDRDQPVFNIKPMESFVAESIAPRRFTMLLLGLFATVALVLAIIGLYGVMSYAVTQRTHEIGVRMALGAQGSDVLKMIVGHAMTLVMIGVVTGLVAAFALTRVISSFLYGVSATDAWTFVAVPLLLCAVAAAASYLPARRATKVDPMVALRYE
ncbi:MAG TPA: ABC transporter permease [Pyrinomonadaceae bacterium]|jgi:putative ABC transport system permease protein|nr:ABC transporter permease [Pyrinomonadaceae bacterium]